MNLSEDIYIKPTFPNWAENSLSTIHNGDMERYIKKILELPYNE